MYGDSEKEPQKQRDSKMQEVLLVGSQGLQGHALNKNKKYRKQHTH